MSIDFIFFFKLSEFVAWQLQNIHLVVLPQGGSNGRQINSICHYLPLPALNTNKQRIVRCLLTESFFLVQQRYKGSDLVTKQCVGFPLLRCFRHVSIEIKYQKNVVYDLTTNFFIIIFFLLISINHFLNETRDKNIHDISVPFFLFVK